MVDQTLPADIELIPDGFEYVAADKVRVTLKTQTGDAVSYTMTVAMLAQSITLGVALINTNMTQALRDLKVF